MRFEIFYALLAFSFVSAITPGPNNLMLMTSGLNFGFRRTIPHMLGVGLGFAIMVGLGGLGVGALFAHFPALLPTMRYRGAAYLLSVPIKRAMPGPASETEPSGKPLSFLAAPERAL